jgi:glycosyltransferase involved in cell wall biosynthesis
VLILAYYFPPIGGGGVQRTLKYVKYLGAEGFDPVVVTARGVGQPLRDDSMLSEVPEETVVIRAPEIPLHLVKWGLESVLRRAGVSIRLAQAVAWPDELVGWAPGALWQALRAVRRYRPDLVYSTSSPVSAHAVALVVRRITGLPWVADFRDPWTLDPQGGHLFGPMSSGFERYLVRQADRIVVVDESVELVGVGPRDPRRVVIRNGVDPDDVPDPFVGRAQRSTFRIAYVGMLYGMRNAAPVIAALRNLAGRGVLDPERLELRTVGEAKFGPGIDLSGLRLSQRGYVSHREAIEEMTAADVLLLYLPPGSGASTGKVFEYLATGRPILCVAPQDTVAAQLITELAAGECADPDDKAGIEQAIARLYERWLAGRLETNSRVREEALRRFSRRVLTHQLAEVLDAACQSRPTHPGSGIR